MPLGYYYMLQKNNLLTKGDYYDKQTTQGHH